MTYHRWLPVALGFLLLGAAFVPCARADAGNKEIHFTVNAPIEIPREVLPPGSYDLKLAQDDNTIAEVWNTQGTHFYGYFNTIQVDRNHPGKLRIDLSDSARGAPERLADWYYPGDKRGNEILYPPPRNLEMANCAAANQQVAR